AISAAYLDTAMKKFITQTVSYYKNKIHSWAVISEPLADNGSIRTNANTSTSGSDVVVWSNFMGKAFGDSAFRFAHAADPSASLFIDESYLDVYPAKVDSLIGYVNRLKGKGAQVDGVGVILHLNFSNSSSASSYANIDNAFKKLGAAGLKVRISALDINENPLGKPNFDPTDVYKLDYQAVAYKFVIDSYIKNIPAAQRAGICLWGVDDGHSNISIIPVTSTTTSTTSVSPLLFDSNFTKKPAFSAVLQSAKGQ
ncbi:MAG TPA: endo-1,4-beta-xylanase, partial [Bacteroidales bacterium]